MLWASRRATRDREILGQLVLCLGEHCRDVISIVERRKGLGAVDVALHGHAAQPGRHALAASQRQLREQGVVAVLLEVGAEPMLVALSDRRGAQVQFPQPLDRMIGDQARVEAPAVLGLAIGRPVGDGAPRKRTAPPLLAHRADSQKGRGAVIAGPEEARTQRPAVKAGEIRITVVVQVLGGLVMQADDDRLAPGVRQG